MKYIYSVSAFRDWLATQDPDTLYDPYAAFNCPLYQYYRAVGLPIRRMATTTWYDVDGGRHESPLELWRIVLDWNVIIAPHVASTFGAALRRANAYLAAHPE